MNVPPTCEFREGTDPECGNLAPWVVINKTDGVIKHICHICLSSEIEMNKSYSVFPAKDYSQPKRSFDREILGEPFIPDKDRCIRCDGVMMPVIVREKIPNFPHLGGKQDGEKKLRPRDAIVCKECGWKEGS
jgi:hypothetical protein